jgi:hypothetical protein
MVLRKPKRAAQTECAHILEWGLDDCNLNARQARSERMLPIQHRNRATSRCRERCGGRFLGYEQQRMTGLSQLSIYYRAKADELRRKAEASTSRTARMWLTEAAGECELRAIQAEIGLGQIAVVSSGATDLASPTGA